MKKSLFLACTLLACMVSPAWSQPGSARVKWDDAYAFDRCNTCVIEFYAKNAELMKKSESRTYYQSAGDNFLVKYPGRGKGNDVETILDKKNEIAVQIFGTGEGKTPMYNAGGYKYPEEGDLKRLEVVPTQETREILGYPCKKYTYTFKKIFGEIWITDQVKLPNDVGVFRAWKMAAKHNTLSVPGYVIEMTTEDSGGGKTLMKTTAIAIQENYRVNLAGVNMTTAFNKINYFTF